MLVPVAAMLFVYLYGKRAGGGLRLFGATGTQRGASVDVKEKIVFHLNKSTLTTHSSLFLFFIFFVCAFWKKLLARFP